MRVQRIGIYFVRFPGIYVVITVKELDIPGTNPPERFSDLLWSLVPTNKKKLLLDITLGNDLFDFLTVDGFAANEQARTRNFAAALDLCMHVQIQTRSEVVYLQIP